MSNLTKREKQSLNELFIVLKDNENTIYRIKYIKKISLFILNNFIKLKKIKYPLI